jgi:hypothetical protein
LLRPREAPRGERIGAFELIYLDALHGEQTHGNGSGLHQLLCAQIVRPKLLSRATRGAGAGRHGRAPELLPAATRISLMISGGSICHKNQPHDTARSMICGKLENLVSFLSTKLRIVSKAGKMSVGVHRY